MTDETPSARCIDRTRRGFLGWAGMAAVVALVPARAALARAATRRSLALVHTHTGERLSSVYFDNGAYQAAELARINHLLRDFRSGDVYPIDPAVLDILSDLQALADREDAYEVICGYRCAGTNAMLRSRSASSGVAEHSLHLAGRAVDIRLPGFSTARLRALAMQLGRGGVGYYAASDFIHVDNGRVRYW